VCEVYGKEYVDRVYGDILPIPVERIIEAPDQHVVSLAGRELLCLDTPGHARHHICIVDRKTGGIFSGDMFGLSYREFDVGERQFIFPTTTPTQFEPEAMRRSITQLLGLKPEAIYLTHYSRIDDVQTLGQDLLRRLDRHVEIALQNKGAGAHRHERIKSALAGYLLGEVRAHGCALSEDVVLGLWDTDLELNAQGLEVWLDTLEKAS
jgi:glyoxylase-like metal-dependent hydrolase (beta-lactamase superfamily II)